MSVEYSSGVCYGWKVPIEMVEKIKEKITDEAYDNLIENEILIDLDQWCGAPYYLYSLKNYRGVEPGKAISIHDFNFDITEEMTDRNLKFSILFPEIATKELPTVFIYTRVY